MTNTVLIREARRLVVGKTYVAFGPEDHAKVLWAGRIVAASYDNAVIMVEQQDPEHTLAAVWSWHLPDMGGSRANYCELGTGDLFDRLPLLATTKQSAAAAFELLVVQHTNDEAVGSFLRRCEHGWWYGVRTDGAPPALDTNEGSTHTFRTNEGELARVACWLLERQNLLCKQPECSA